MTGDQPCPINLLATQDIYAEGNMVTIAETIPINISRTPDVMENVFVGADCSPKEIQIYTNLFKEFRDVFAWSYEEMPGIDLKIVEHEITMYPDAKPVRQKLRPVNPRKAAAIKTKVEKKLHQATLRQRSHHIRIYSCCLISSLMLPLSPMHIHPTKSQVKRRD
jgi:hypothetical protein